MAEKKLRSEQVYEEIKALIMSMELRPGEPLAELTLCERLGVSRTPIRTALMASLILFRIEERLLNN